MYICIWIYIYIYTCIDVYVCTYRKVWDIHVYMQTGSRAYVVMLFLVGVFAHPNCICTRLL